MTRRPLRAVALAGAALLVLATTAPVHAAPALQSRGGGCFSPATVGAAGRAAPGARTRDADTRSMSASEQRAVEQRTRDLLAARGKPGTGPFAAVTVPVYVHDMVDTAGNGTVTSQQVSDQIAVLNATYAGTESSQAGNSGFSFSLAGFNTVVNDAWHQDKQSATYRKQTRQGGKNALNIWLVDFSYLGIATFPWDYRKSPGTDGIRVQWDSLPGGHITHYNLGKTATHEAGHWFGLYHTFQGGCTTTNDEVSDTPAQSGPTTGCPSGADTCTLPGLDPIHNYMDYSYDDCYNQFTPGQVNRMQSMWSAYRA